MWGSPFSDKSTLARAFSDPSWSGLIGSIVGEVLAKAGNV